MARKKEKEQRKKKPQDENIMACPIIYRAAVTVTVTGTAGVVRLWAFWILKFDWSIAVT